MPLSKSGADISRHEVTNIDAFGFWMLVDDKEYHIAFAEYPAFRDATIGQILNVEEAGPGQYHWPEIDQDIELDALEYPAQFPLQYGK